MNFIIFNVVPERGKVFRLNKSSHEYININQVMKDESVVHNITTYQEVHVSDERTISQNAKISSFIRVDIHPSQCRRILNLLNLF